MAVRKTVLRNARLIDGTGAPPRPATVTIGTNGTIEAIAANEAPGSDDADLVDLNGKTIIPGMFDCHLHFKMGIDDAWKVKASKVPVDLDMPMTLIGIRGFARARLALRMGFTTVRDVGDTNRLAAALRDSIASGYVEGPRIVSSGEALTMTGGTTDFFPDWLSRADVSPPRADGPDALRRAVRTQIKGGANWIKFIATGTMGPTAMHQEFDDDEIAALVGEARRHGVPVCAHACYAQGALAIAKAGVQSIEHGCELTEEIVALMIEKDIFLVPTLGLFDSMVTFGPELGLPQSVIDMAARKLERHVTSFQLALRSGVSIANGSDIGSPACAHGRQARELGMLVKYGMTPMQALTTATASSARLLKVYDRLGTIEVGKTADLVIVDGDPLLDIGILEHPDRITGVFKDGTSFVDAIGGQAVYRPSPLF